MTTCLMCENKVTGSRFCSEQCMQERINQVCANDKSHTERFSRN